MIPFKPNKQYTRTALWISGVIAISIVIAAIIFNIEAVGAGVSYLLSALSPLLYGLIFAYLLRPLDRRLELLFFKIFRISHLEEGKRRRAEMLARVCALIFTYLIIFLVVFLFVYFLLPLLLGDSRLLGERFLGLLSRFSGLIGKFSSVFGIGLSASELYQQLLSYGNVIMEGLLDFSSALLITTFDMIVGLCLSAGILYNRVHLTACARRLIVALFPARACHYIHRVADYSDHTFGKYLVGKIVECLIIGALYLIVLPIMGAPYPFLIALIMTITNFIPVIGAYIGGIPSGLLILTAADPIMVVWFALLCLAVEQIDGNIVAPRVLGSVLGLRPVWIMVSVVLFGGFFGIFGMFLSAPIFSIFYMLLRDATHHRLQKKGRPIESEHYETMFATVTPRRRRFFRYHFSLSHTKEQDSEGKE